MLDDIVNMDNSGIVQMKTAEEVNQNDLPIRHIKLYEPQRVLSYQ